MESQPKLDSVQQPSVLLVVFSHYSAHQVNYLLQGDAEGDDDGRGLVQHGAVLDVVILQEVIQQLLLVRASAASWWYNIIYTGEGQNYSKYDASLRIKGFI